LSQIAPRKVSAGVGNLKVTAYSGLVGEKYWVYMDITEGSYGGRYGKDGMDCVDTLYANTRNNPIEDIESHYPLRVTRYELREDKAGPGQWRGGVGSIRDVMFTIPGGRVSVEGDGHKYNPWGIFGGQNGATGGLILNPERETEQHLPSKISDRRCGTGDTFRSISACGGGYGEAYKRDPQKVLDDVLDGLVSREGARDYGVVITEQMTIDQEETNKLRSQ
jgi:N-methylhydantoinase B